MDSITIYKYKIIILLALNEFVNVVRFGELRWKDLCDLDFYKIGILSKKIIKLLLYKQK